MAAFLAYRQATTEPERRKWICIAANRDLPEAQTEIARLHWRPPGLLASPFERDGYKAYIWSIIAIQRPQPLEDMERRLGWAVTEGERWRAMLLAVSWRPDPRKCENMEDSEYFSIAPVAGAGPTPEEVLAAARAGDARAAFLAYRQATTDAERRKWICIAANRDHHEAQVEIARLHLWSPGDPPSPFAHDKHKAYIWSIIAIHRRQPLEDMERRLGWAVTEGERWRAMVLAVAWRPDPSQCENIEDSEYFSIVPIKGAETSF
jgi:TPR repeat protein